MIATPAARRNDPFPVPPLLLLLLLMLLLFLLLLLLLMLLSSMVLAAADALDAESAEASALEPQGRRSCSCWCGSKEGVVAKADEAARVRVKAFTAAFDTA